jgi:hypothetical protein
VSGSDDVNLLHDSTDKSRKIRGALWVCALGRLGPTRHPQWKDDPRPNSLGVQGMGKRNLRVRCTNPSVRSPFGEFRRARFRGAVEPKITLGMRGEMVFGRMPVVGCLLARNSRRG